jgi:AAA domain
MKFEIVKAQESRVLVRGFVAGFTETGKSYTALVAAQALKGKCIVLDSEQHSVRRYAKKFPDWDFDILPLPDFKVDTYCDAIQYAIDKKYEVIVVDSLTPIWDSRGGLCEQAEEHAQAKPGTIQLGWSKAKNQAKRVVQDFSRANAHLIYTIRSSGEYEKEGGKFKIVGERLNFAKGIEYDFNVKIWMDEKHSANITIRGMEEPIDVVKPSVADFTRLFSDFQSGKDTNIFDELKQLVTTSTDVESVKAQLSANKHWLNADQIKELGTLLKAKTLK